GDAWAQMRVWAYSCRPKCAFGPIRLSGGGGGAGDGGGGDGGGGGGGGRGGEDDAAVDEPGHARGGPLHAVGVPLGAVVGDAVAAPVVLRVREQARLAWRRAARAAGR